MGATINAINPPKERVLLLNPPGTQFYVRDKYCTSISVGNYYWPQIDLLVLSGRLKTDYDVTLLDAVVSHKKPATLIPQLAGDKYKAIIFLTSLASYKEDFAFIRVLKDLCPETEMIGIGGLLLMQGEKILEQHPCLDAVLLDFTSEHILDYLAGQNAVPDMITRINGEIVRGVMDARPTFSYRY